MRNVKEYQEIFDRLADGLKDKARDLKERLDDAFESDYERALEIIMEMIEVFTRLKTLSEMGGPFVSLLESIESIETLRGEIVDRASQLGPEFLRFREYSAKLHDMGIREFEQLFAAETGDPEFHFDLALSNLGGLECIRLLAPDAFGDEGPLKDEEPLDFKAAVEAKVSVEVPEAELEQVPEPIASEEENALSEGGSIASIAEEVEEEPSPLEMPIAEEEVPSAEALIGLLQEEPLKGGAHEENTPEDTPPEDAPPEEGEDLEDEVLKELERIRLESTSDNPEEAPAPLEIGEEMLEAPGNDDPFAAIFQNGSKSTEEKDT